MPSSTQVWLESPEGQVVIAAGEAGALCVNLPLANRTGAPAVVSDAAVADMVSRDGGHRLSGPIAARVAVLGPNQRASTSLRFDFDPRTPPGVYDGELRVAGTTRRLELTIVEHVRLEIEPREIVIDRSARPPLRKTVVFHNRGNVALRIGDPGPVAIGLEQPFAATTTASVTAGDRVGQAIGKLLGKLVEGRETHLLEDSGTMTVRLTAGAVVLAPGASAHAEIECVLPETLLGHRRYRAFAPLYDTDLAFVIITAVAGEVRPPRRPRRRS